MNDTRTQPHLAFIGGGNMASAIIGGLLRQGHAKEAIDVVEPLEAARQRLHEEFGLKSQPHAGTFLQRANLVLWAVKPQALRAAAIPVAAHTAMALHLSVAAGVPSDSLARWLLTERVIRTMPNTPALIGKGITGAFARAAVSAGDRTLASQVLASTGALIWLETESQLDAVTALSGSGPAYVFYFLEAMADTGVELGLSREHAYRLAVATFIGAGELAHASKDPPDVLRARVTSKGGTTHAAMTVMEDSAVKAAFSGALRAAHTRALEMGREYGDA